MYDVNVRKIVGHLIDSVPSTAQVYPPSKSDLISICSLVIKEGIVSAMEFGSGWTTLALAAALRHNQGQKLASQFSRHPNLYQLQTIDASAEYLGIAMSRLEHANLSEAVMGHVSVPEMTHFRGQICHMFSDLPPFTADFILLDGPDPNQVAGDSRGFHIRFGDSERTYGLPMAADILAIEPFLWPGTIVLVDGRGANARFLATNLSRNWSYVYSEALDQHFFYLEEKPWGLDSRRLLELRSGRALKEIVVDLEKVALTE